MSDGGDAEQTRFRDGRVVRDSVREAHGGDPARDGAAGDDPVRPDQATGFAVTVKPGALEANRPLAEARDEHGDVLSFASRAAAEAFAARLSAADGALRVQAAAPNDPADVDAYLLAAHDPSVREPAAVEGDALTFDVGANRYGALGEALVTAGPRPPALEHWVVDDLADEPVRGELRVRVGDAEPVTFGEGPDRTRWRPDCRVEARDGPGGRLVERYYGEVKAGDASFERTQVAAMRELARTERVLKVRVLLDELPERYTVRVREVDPEGE